jgi:tryptophan 2,3-dioxygenase
MAIDPQRNTYSTYLQLAQLLSAQKTSTASDDELLFIVIHQSHELWFKLAIHELDCAITALAPPGGSPHKTDSLLTAYKRLARVGETLELLISSWSVLRTLTPDEFHVFRSTVGRDGASGFQSVQYRVLEFKLGLKYRQLDVDAGKKSVFGNGSDEDERALEAALAGKSIYDAVNVYLARHRKGYGIADPRKGDYTQRYAKQLAVFRCWRDIYEDREEAPDLYQLGEKLVDVEDAFRRWRLNHLSTVSRIIGSNTGTGGSSGLRYLKGVANQLYESPMFPELWDVRNYMFNKAGFDEERAGYVSSTG